MNFVLAVRKTKVWLLLVLGSLTFISGVVLLIMPGGPGSGEALLLGLSKHTWEDVHIYAGFAAAGCIVVHLAANVNALKYYLLGKRG